MFLRGSGNEHHSRTEAGIKLFISFFISSTADEKRGPARGLNADKKLRSWDTRTLFRISGRELHFPMAAIINTQLRRYINIIDIKYYKLSNMTTSLVISYVSIWATCHRIKSWQNTPICSVGRLLLPAGREKNGRSSTLLFCLRLNLWDKCSVNGDGKKMPFSGLDVTWNLLSPYCKKKSWGWRWCRSFPSKKEGTPWEK